MDLLEELPNILDSFSGLASKIRRIFSGVSLSECPRRQHLLLLTYSTLFSNFTSCIALLRARQFSSVPLVLRPVLEACADIINITADDKYIDKLYCGINMQQLKYLRGLTSLKNVPDFVSADLPEYEKRFIEYKDEKIEPISKRGKFVAAGMDDAYTAIYSMMSGAVHNDFNFTLCKNPDMSDDFIELHEKQSRAFEMLFAYVSFMHDAIVMSTKMVVQSVKDCDREAYSSFQADIDNLKKHLGLIALMYTELPENEGEQRSDLS